MTAPVKRGGISHLHAAAAWLAEQPWFATWTAVPGYTCPDHAPPPERRRRRAAWMEIATALQDAEFYSRKTSAIDLPIAEIVTEAIAVRRRAATS